MRERTKTCQVRNLNFHSEEAGICEFRVFLRGLRESWYALNPEPASWMTGV